MEQYTVYLLIERDTEEESLRYKTSDIMAALSKLAEHATDPKLFNWHISACPIEGFVYEDHEYEVLR